MGKAAASTSIRRAEGLLSADLPEQHPLGAGNLAAVVLAGKQVPVGVGGQGDRGMPQVALHDLERQPEPVIGRASFSPTPSLSSGADHARCA